MDALESSDHALKERTLIELDCKIGATYLRMKRTADADRHFSRAVKTFDRRLARGADDPFTKYYMAALYALKGETDRALRYLDDTIQHLPALNRTRARMDPDFDAVRTDPRFTALVDGH